MSFDDSFLLNQFPRLPFDLIIGICEHLRAEHVLKCLICLENSKLRKQLINTYFQGRMDFYLSDPHDRYYYTSKPKLYRLCWYLNHSPIWCFGLFDEYENFLDSNPDINPPKLKLIDFSSTHLMSNRYFKKYFSRFSSKVDKLLLEMDVVYEDLNTLVDMLENVYGIVSGSFEKCIEQLEDGVLLKWNNLSLFRTKEPRLKDWSRIKFPPSLKTFKLEFCHKIDLSTLKIPASVENISICNLGEFKCTYDQFDHPVPVEFPLEIFPLCLKTLEIHYIHRKKLYFNFNVKKLPRSLTSIDLNFTNILDFGSEKDNFNPSVSWPPLLETIKLMSCSINYSSIGQLSSMGWPKGLRYLDLCENDISSLSWVNFLPERLDEIRLYTCDSVDPWECTERVRFPSYMTNIAAYSLKSLSIMEFPVYLKVLSLRYSNIKDLNEYEEVNISWAKLTNLESLDLSKNKISCLLYWDPPTNLKFLNLSDNQLAEITSDCPIFDGSQNKRYSKLRKILLKSSNIHRIDDLVCVPPNLSELLLTENTELDLVPLHRKFLTPNLKELHLYRTKVPHMEHNNTYFSPKLIYVNMIQLERLGPNDD